MLVAEMKPPGSASLELAVEPLAEDRAALVATARFHPAGAASLLYWYALRPLHGWLFRGMTRAIGEAAVAGIETPEAPDGERGP